MKKVWVFLRVIVSILLFLVLLFFILDKVSPVDTSKIEDVSKVLKSDDGTWLYVTTNQTHKWRFTVELEKLDPNFIALLLAFEDKRFYRHYGVDFLALSRALKQLIQEKRVVSGASTITMQLARLLHPRKRTISSKLIEMFRALQLELHYSKDEILAAYLTLTPYGGNIEGIVAASMRYFGKYPYSLSASQMALLVALPQSPESNRPDRHYKRSIQARDKVLAYAKSHKRISEYAFNQAKNEALPKQLKRMPRFSPHLAQKLLKKEGHEVDTTLHADLQKQLEHWALSKSTLLAKGTTLAVLVVRNADASIQAYLASHNMFSSNVSGYVDMIEAIRSPGSTLKPFIYAKGFEAHVIHPNMMILDKETRFGDYIPHNFSYTYSGEVRLKSALQNSLNIPAVKILNKIGVEPFVQSLVETAGVLKIPKKRATLPIALGGVGLSMWQLTQLYVALANKGSSESIHYLPVTIKGMKAKRLLSAKAAKMTTSILRDTPAPYGFINAQQQIAYKTGTSYGYRDAWTIAYTKDYTVAVWVGKPDNSIQLKKTGRETAAPLAFEVFSLLSSLGLGSHWQWPASYLGTEAPMGLQHFDKAIKENEAKLTFLYPKEGERFMSADCSDAFVEIKVENGKEPYYWYVDAEALESDKNTLDMRFKHGGHTIHVIDSNGATSLRNIWVNKPEC